MTAPAKPEPFDPGRFVKGLIVLIVIASGLGLAAGVGNRVYHWTADVKCEDAK